MNRKQIGFNLIFHRIRTSQFHNQILYSIMHVIVMYKRKSICPFLQDEAPKAQSAIVFSGMDKDFFLHVFEITLPLQTHNVVIM